MHSKFVLIKDVVEVEILFAEAFDTMSEQPVVDAIVVVVVDVEDDKATDDVDDEDKMGVVTAIELTVTAFEEA